jgi:hypothetical protein
MFQASVAAFSATHLIVNHNWQEEEQCNLKAIHFRSWIMWQPTATKHKHPSYRPLQGQGMVRPRSQNATTALAQCGCL